jgi:hypothetical protein
MFFHKKFKALLKHQVKVLQVPLELQETLDLHQI